MLGVIVQKVEQPHWGHSSVSNDPRNVETIEFFLNGVSLGRAGATNKIGSRVVSFSYFLPEESFGVSVFVVISLLSRV